MPQAKMGADLASPSADDKPAKSRPSESPEQLLNGLPHLLDDLDREFERRLVFDHVVDQKTATARQRFEGIAKSIRDQLTKQWLETDQIYSRLNPKRVYYFSMEYLLGRSLTNNIINLQMHPAIQEVMRKEGLDLNELVGQEPDAGLGNGGLGRLAACFMDSLATLQYPAMGYGLRYEYGIFRQEIEGGAQVERPDNWLRHPDPWEVPRPEKLVHARLNCSVRFRDGSPYMAPNTPGTLLGIPCDRPIVGYSGRTINTLRLWKAASPDFFNLGEFNQGDFFGSVLDRVAAENLTRVLYPDDSTEAGKRLRFVQEYFLVACSLSDIVRRFRKANHDWRELPNQVAIQLNDTHPALSVPELMRILLDEAHLGWDEAWDITVRTLAYTNHTLLPEALERWPVSNFELALPRHLEIVYEINRRFLNSVREKHPGDDGFLARVSLIEEGDRKQVRMANLAIVGTHSTNGVAAIHSRLLRERTVKEFAEIFPDRFTNVTNGITPRRWLLDCNPALAELITSAIGDDWITELMNLKKLAPLADDAGFRADFRRATETCKHRFVDWLKRSTGRIINPDSLFDSQVKRIHEYKRQLLNVLRIVIEYNRLRAKPDMDIVPRTFFFAGKAAPAYTFAKLIIHLINDVAATIDADHAVRGRMAVLFLHEYNVSLAERLIPASDVSEQISTAGFEASGTSNMKFMLNGALTVGTRDGATIEMAEAAGEENFFLFGLTAEQVASSRGWYDPHWHYHNDAEIREALDLIASGHFSRGDASRYQPIRDQLLARGDYYMHLADLASYLQTQERVSALYKDPDAWSRKAILNVVHAGRFSSDRCIQEYSDRIWHVKPCPVE
jgi:starch phosphorylase